jgi:fibronectin-binding autotransporter adhesin
MRRRILYCLNYALLVAFLMLLPGSYVFSATRTASVSGNWSSTTTWGGSAVPTSSDAVVVNSGITVTVDITAVCTTITINAAAATNGITISGTNSLTASGAVTMNAATAGVTSSISVGAGTFGAASISIAGSSTSGRVTLLSVSTGTINCSGAITFSGTAAQARLTFSDAGTLNITGNLGTGGTFTASTGTVNYNASGVQTIGLYTYYNLTLSGTSAKTFPTGTTTVNGTLSLEGTATATVTGTLTYGAAATLQYNKSGAVTPGSEWKTPFTATGGVVIGNTGLVTMPAAKVFNAGIPLTINSGASLSTSTYLLTLGGNFSNSGTFTSGTGGITITGTATTQTLSGFTTTGNLSMTKTAGVATITGTVSAVNLAVNGSGGTLDLQEANTFSGTRIVTAGTLRLSNTAALGAAGTAVSLNGGVLDLMTDVSTNAYNITVGGAATIRSNRATSGDAITHTLGTLSIGNYQLSITVGTNSTSGIAGITFGTTTLSAATPKFDVAANANLTLGALTGNYAFTKQNSGQLTLNTASSRTAGTVTLTAGTLVLGSTSALGTTGVALALNGGVLDLQTDASVNAYNVTVAGTPTIASDRATAGAGITHTLGTLSIGNYTINLNVGTNVSSGTAGLKFGTTTLSAATPVFDVASGANMTLGALSGSYAFTKQDAGQLTLNTASARTSGTVTLTAGTISVGNVTAFGTSAVPLVLNGGILDLSTDATITAYPVTVGGTATIMSDRATSGAAITHTLGTLSIGNNQLNVTAGTSITSGVPGLTFGATTFSASTSIFDVDNNVNLTLGALSGDYAFTKQDLGQLTLNSASARAGGTVTLSAGTLLIGSTSALGAATVPLVLNGGTLDLMTSTTVNAYNITVGGDVTIQSDRATAGAGITHILGTLTIGNQTLSVNKGTNVSSGTAAVQFGNLTLTDDATLTPGTANILMSGTSSGSFKLTKSGSGLLQKNTSGWTLGGDFEITLGTYDANGRSTTVTGLTTLSGGTYTAGSAAQTFNGDLTLSGGTYTGLSGTTAGITSVSTLTLSSGTFSAPGSTGTFSISGDLINNGATLNLNSGTVTLNGSSSQNIGGSTITTFNNLSLNNASGVSLNLNSGVNGVLAFTTGVITTGSNKLILGNSATVTGATDGAYVFGNLSKGIAASTASMSFEIGDANYYTPVATTFTGTTNGTGSITAKSTAGDHPNINTSAINPALSVNRYWTLSNSGVTGFSSYDITMTFDPADIDAGADYNSFITGNYSSSAWNYPVPGLTSPTTNQALDLTTFGDFQVGQSTGETTACQYGDNGSSPAVSDVMPCISFPSHPSTVSTTLAAHQYFTLNVIKGITYQVYTCNGSAPSNPLKMVVYKEGAPSDPYIAFSYSNSGNPCTSVTNNVYVTFTAGFSGQVRVLINRKSDCSSTTPSGLTVMVNAKSGSNLQDDELASGTDSWIGQMYNGTNSSVLYNGTFLNYLGYYTEAESFNESFGGSTNCFGPVNSAGSQRATLYTEAFSVRYRMTSSRSGLYIADIGSDDGGRLAVDGNLIFNDWIPQSFSLNPRVLMSLTGTSSLVLDYYANTGTNQVAFQNITLVLANTLSSNLTQSICQGNSGSAISGDTYGTLPTGISLSGTGYQWTYSTTPGGARTNISGATSATFSPNTSDAPFNVAGTYYVYRNAILRSSNNVSPNPYVATNESNAATITVNVLPAITETTPAARCGAGTVTLEATASTGTINWYAASTGGSSLGTGTTFTTPSITTSTTYYVDATLNSCTSTPRVAVLASVIPAASITAGGGGIYCTGSTVALTSTGTNIGNQYWVGPNNYYSQSQNPSLGSATATLAGTYTVTGSSLSGINLVTNGDFESGNTGFTSGYTNSTDLQPEGTYAVVANPTTVHPSFSSCADHTPSGTLQMVINGAGSAGVVVWSETVTVVPGLDYQFSYWVQSVVASNPSQMQLYINSVAVGPVYTALTSTCNWLQFFYNWNSGASSTAVLSLVNQNIILTGNDFALDDIIFQQVCQATSTATVVVNPYLPVSVSIGASATSICSGTSVTFTATPTNGGSSPTYQWKLNGTNVGTNSATYINASLANSDQVTCTLTSNYSCTTGNPATSNTITMSVTAGGTWLGSVSTDWNVAGNWSCSQIPDLTTNVQIPNVTNKPILNNGSIGAVKNLVIASSSSLTVISNTLQIGGTITNSGTFTASSGTIEMKGSSAQTIGAGVFAGNTIKNLTINNSSGVTLLGTLNLTGILLATSGNLATGGYLTLISSATQTALIDGSGTGNVSGNVTMQRYLATGFGYKYLSSPFQAATVNVFADDIDLTASFPTFYKYDENLVSTGWVNYTSTSGTLVPMQGYAGNFGTSLTAKTVTATGVVSNGTITPVTLYNHNKTYTLGFNLAGNPYPSPIDWNAASGWTKTNIDNAVYYFNNGSSDQYTGTYSTYINGVSSDGVANNIIPSMQGFFIHVSNGTYPVTAQFGMTNSVRINNLTPVFHKPLLDAAKPMIRLTAAFDRDGNTPDPVVIYFDETATKEFDKDHDALKLFNTDAGVPNIYSISPDGKWLSINAIPYPEDSLMIIPLGIRTEEDGLIRLNTPAMERIPSTYKVYLYDASTKYYRDLSVNTESRCFLPAGNNVGRFTIVFSKKPLKYGTGREGEFIAYGKGGRIVVYGYLASGETAEINVYNMVGQLLGHKIVTENAVQELDLGITNGVYLVEFASPRGKQSKKVLITNQ